jgi:hypothetical protein
VTARTRYVVAARKIPYEQRDVAHAVITAEDPRGFRDVIDADDDPAVPVGAPVAYVVHLTDEEAERFRQASNCRYIIPDQQATLDGPVEVLPAGEVETAAAAIPPAATMRWMGATPELEATWHGRDVTIAVIDGGTTDAVRQRFGWQMVARRNFVNDDPGMVNDHGCLVTPEAVPAGGRLVEAVVFSAEGSAWHSDIAAALKFTVDAGAQVVNFSGGGDQTSPVEVEGLRYAADRGVVVVASAGNDGQPFLGWPARHSETMPAVRSSIAFSEATGLRAPFSNYAASGSGCAPGQRSLSVDPAARDVLWSGTSSSAPKMTRLIGMGMTGGRYSALQVADALTAAARDTAAPDAEEGAGAWHLQAALERLAAQTPPPAPEPTPEPTPEPAPAPAVPPATVTAWAERTQAGRWRAKRDRAAAGEYLAWLQAQSS